MSNKDMTGGLLKEAEWAEYMTAEELFGHHTWVLGKAILHRRERLAADIPEQLDARGDELTKAASMARAAKSKRDDVNVSCILENERNAAQAKKLLFMEGTNSSINTLAKTDTDSEPEWARAIVTTTWRPLFSPANKLGHPCRWTFNPQSDENLIREHEDWVENRKEKFAQINQMKELQENAKQLLDTVDKAITHNVQLYDENQIFHDTISRTSRKKGCYQRTTRLAQALDESQRGIEFGKIAFENGFHELLLMLNAFRMEGNHREFPVNGAKMPKWTVKKNERLSKTAFETAAGARHVSLQTSSRRNDIPDFNSFRENDIEKFDSDLKKLTANRWCEIKKSRITYKALIERNFPEIWKKCNRWVIWFQRNQPSSGQEILTMPLIQE